MNVTDLTAKHIGANVRIEHSGWVHTGQLVKVEFEQGWRSPDEVRTFIAVKSESGARWAKILEDDHPIEVQSDE